MIQKHKEIILVTGFFTLIRLLVSPTFGLGVDEAHYVLYARNLDWSYVDHPPLVGWIHALFYYTLGSGEFAARLPAVILFAIVSLFSYRFILSFSGSKNIALTGVLAINGSFMLNALSIMLLPDSILFVLIFPLIWLTRRIASHGRFRDFALLGIVLGTAGLAKYTAILFVPPILVYLIMKKRYDLIFSRHMIFAGFLALLMITPVICWNIQHDFISFRYQTGHVLGPSLISLEKPLVSLAAQFGAYSPFLFFIAFYGFFKGLRHPDDSIRLAILFGGVIYVFFLYSSFYETALPHWTSPFYLLLIPVGVFYLMNHPTPFKRKFLKVSLWFSLILTLFLYMELSAKFFRFPDYNSPFRDIYGYETIAKEADEVFRANDHSRKGLAVSNWTMGSRIMYYSMSYDIPVFIIDERIDQFDLWQTSPPEGRDLLFLNTHFTHLDLEKTVVCDRVQPVKTIDISLNGGKVDTVEYVWCMNYRGMKK
jgi:4-amino-4-deoxy-L-arabinose transferase-like glycosyltransferase